MRPADDDAPFSESMLEWLEEGDRMGEGHSGVHRPSERYQTTEAASNRRIKYFVGGALVLAGAFVLVLRLVGGHKPAGEEVAKAATTTPAAPALAATAPAAEEMAAAPAPEGEGAIAALAPEGEGAIAALAPEGTPVAPAPEGTPAAAAPLAAAPAPSEPIAAAPAAPAPVAPAPAATAPVAPVAAAPAPVAPARAALPAATAPIVAPDSLAAALTASAPRPVAARPAASSAAPPVDPLAAALSASTPRPAAVAAPRAVAIREPVAPAPLAKVPPAPSPVAKVAPSTAPAVVANAAPPLQALTKASAKISAPGVMTTPAPAPAGVSAAYTAALTQCRAYVTAGKLRHAVDSCRLANAAEPRAPEALTLLAEAEFTRGHTGVALRLATEATNVAPGYADAYVIIGGIYQDKGKSAEARAAYEQYLALQPKGKHAADLRAILAGIP